MTEHSGLKRMSIIQKIESKYTYTMGENKAYKLMPIQHRFTSLIHLGLFKCFVILNINYIYKLLNLHSTYKLLFYFYNLIYPT